MILFKLVQPVRVAAQMMAFVVSSATAVAQTAPKPCPVIAGGGGIMVHGYPVIFSATSDSAGSTLHGAVIVRAPESFRSQPPSKSQPRQWLAHGGARHYGGGNVGSLQIIYEPPANRVWIDSLAISLEAGNNVLLVDVDARGVPAIFGQARLDLRVPVPPGPCDDAAALRRYQLASDLLWARFTDSPTIHSFLVR